MTAAVTVMVPNSLGPGELLMHYGTRQKQKYLAPLPRAWRSLRADRPRGRSDAAATQSEGIVEKRIVDGVEVLGVRFNWMKRYITLRRWRPIARLRLGILTTDRRVDRGITCARSRARRRRDRSQRTIRWVPFTRPITPRRVGLFDSSSRTRRVGNGWRMLMECLAPAA